MRSRWVGLITIVAIVASLAAWGIARAVEDRKCRGLLAEALREMDAGQYRSAQKHLSDVLARRPGWDDARYHRGVCEQAQQQVQAAWDDFERVSPDSEWAGWSDVRRSRIALDRGRFAQCEDLLVRAANRPGPHVAEAQWGLVLLLRMQGRNDEARRGLQAGFDRMSSAVITLQRLYKLDVDPFPIEGIRRTLDRALQQAPDDDRVWLARANLAIREGDFEEARRRLDRCLARRPEDPAVWRMRLDWALAANRPDEVRRILPHLPADDEPEGRALTLRAWLAARRGDHPAERHALEAKIKLDQGDAPARERLAELEQEAGRTAEARALRAAVRSIEHDRWEYARQLVAPDPQAHAGELARLAGRLGRSFDAERWASIAAGSRGRNVVSTPSGHPVSRERTAATHRTTLADLVLDDADRTDRQPKSASSPSRPPRGVPQFVDDATAAGLSFLHESGGAKGRLIPPVTASGGVGLLDYDGDGWLDVYLVQGGPFPPDAKVVRNDDRLFRNRGDGTFEDATVASGLAAMRGGYGHGVAVGDYDNDGRPDLFVTRWKSYALHRNRGDGTFEDVTNRAGLGGDRDWPTSAAFADLDGDGDLDLYVCHYMKWDDRVPRSCSDPADPTVYRCLPLDFEALPDHLFRNDGGRFVDVSGEAGIVDRDGRGWGVVAADLDEDGRVDLFVANDMTANFFFRNRGGLKFEESALTAGLAGNGTGAYQAGMGVACGDLDGDGRIDLAVTNFYNESTTYFRNLGQGIFCDQTSAIGLAVPSRYVLGFGTAFFDADNDGWLDLITANGHIHDGRPQFPWKMPVQLYLNDGRGRVVDVTRQAGEPFAIPRLGRGLAAGDLDNDGRVDVVIVSQDEPVMLLHNQSAPEHFLTLGLRGTASNRDAVGAGVTVIADGRARVAQRFGGGSFQSAADPRLHFGLVAARRVDRVEVRWPSGRVDRFDGLAADTGYLLREGDPLPATLPGWRRK